MKFEIFEYPDDGYSRLAVRQELMKEVWSTVHRSPSL